MNASPHFHAPVRADADVEIDRLFHLMVNAESAEAKVSYGRRFTDAIRERNANRTPEQVAALELELGLR